MKCARCGKENPAEIHTCTPLALTLADKLEHQVGFGSYNWEKAETMMLEAAIELRRLYAENEALRAAINKLHKAKGRYHTQLAVCDLFELCGLTAERPKK